MKDKPGDNAHFLGAHHQISGEGGWAVLLCGNFFGSFGAAWFFFGQCWDFF